MPLTRRVQVYIGGLASDALDRIVKDYGGQTKAIEAAILHLDSEFSYRRDSDGTTGGRTTAQPDGLGLAPAGLLADHPMRDEYLREMGLNPDSDLTPNSLSGEAKEERSKNRSTKEKAIARAERKAELQKSVKEALPLARTGAQPIPKPGKK